MKDLTVYVLAGAIVLVGVLQYVKDPVNVELHSQDGEVKVVETLGGFAGPDVSFHATFQDSLTKGGRVVATSTAGNSTLLAADLVGRGGHTSRLEVTPTQGNVTLTLPASSTLTALAPKNGDVFSFVIENEATAATTTTIAAGSGMDLQEPDGQNVVIGQNNFAIVTMMRDENRDFIVWVDETIPAD